MGLLTVSAIKQEILHHHANRQDIVSRLNIAIDLAMMRIARIHDWDQLKLIRSSVLAVTVSASADKIFNLNTAIPTGFRLKTLYSIRVISSDGRSNKLTGLTHTQFDQEVPEPQWYARNMPELYTVFGDLDPADVTPPLTARNPILELWPVPDVAYNIDLRFQVWPRFLTDAAITDANQTDLFVDDAIISLATSYLYNSQGREDKAKHHFGIYSAIVKDALNLDETDFHTVIAGVVLSEGSRVGKYVSNPFVFEAP
jgi:hypothetical protein